MSASTMDDGPMAGGPEEPRFAEPGGMARDTGKMAPTGPGGTARGGEEAAPAELGPVPESVPESGGTRIPRFVVLASGNGGNFQALSDACSSGKVRARMVALVSDRKDALVLALAARASIPGLVLPAFTDIPRRGYDAALAATVQAFRPDYVLLLGWMRMLSSTFLERFPNRVINLHPALPGAFPGTQAIERAYLAWKGGGARRTGVMIHFVPDEGMDDGPLIATAEVDIDDGDDLPALEKKIHAAEHALLVHTMARISAAPHEE